MILYQYECREHGVFEEMSEIEDRHTAICPQCKKVCNKIISVSQANANFIPHWDYDLYRRPIYLTSRDSRTKVANALGNYNNAPFARRESGEVKILDKKAKRSFHREYIQRRGEF